MRALRHVQRGVPDLPVAWRRAGRPAGAHLPDQGSPGGNRRRCRERAYGAHPPRPLPDLPRLRGRLPVRGAVRGTAGNRPGGDGGADPPRALGCGGKKVVGQRCTGPASVRALGRPGPALQVAFARGVAQDAAGPGGGAHRRAGAGPGCGFSCLPPHAHAEGLCATGRDAGGQRGGREAFACQRHRGSLGGRGRLLRRFEPASRPDRGGARTHAREHRCDAAAARRCGCDRFHPPAAAASP